jgi:hypothetical protein
VAVAAVTTCTKKFGVTLRYPVAQFSQRRDSEVIARARRAVPRLPRDPDTGAGPFCATPKKCAPKRDIEMDFWRGHCGLEQHEVKKLRQAFKGSGVEVQVKPLRCCGSEPA